VIDVVLLSIDSICNVGKQQTLKPGRKGEQNKMDYPGHCFICVSVVIGMFAFTGW